MVDKGRVSVELRGLICARNGAQIFASDLYRGPTGLSDRRARDPPCRR